MADFTFDIFIIGAGSGGVRAARLAAKLGKKVGVAEQFRVGGTCVIRGCVPKKLMVFASDFRESAKDSAGFGWYFEEVKFNWQILISRMSKEIARLESIYLNTLSESGVTLFNSRATFTDKNELELANGDRVKAKTILIASGSIPYVPDVVGWQNTITSDDVFHLPTIPKRILIQGGGYIACEFAAIFNGLGVDVIQSYRGDKILRGFDGEVRDHVSKSMLSRGIDIRVNSTLTSYRKVGNNIEALFDDGNIELVDHVLCATGRTPNTFNLRLEKIGVHLDKKNGIIVDDFQKTSVPTIYAIGDVTNRLNLTPVAIRDAVAFIETAVKNKPTSPDHSCVPTAVFTRPEVGSVGLTEEEASALGEIEIFKTQFNPMFNSMAGKNEKILMKVIVQVSSQRVLGCHIVGPSASEIIQSVAIAVKMGATKEDFDKTCAVHPTIAEELVTLK